MMLLFLSLLTFPESLCIRVLGKLLGPAPQNVEAVANSSHSNVSQQFLTIPPDCLSPPLPPSFSLGERDSDQPGLMTTGMQFAVLSAGNPGKVCVTFTMAVRQGTRRRHSSALEIDSIIH